VRYEIRFYDKEQHVKLTIELDAVDAHAAEQGAFFYLRDLIREGFPLTVLRVGAVLRSPR